MLLLLLLLLVYLNNWACVSNSIILRALSTGSVVYAFCEQCAISSLCEWAT